MTDYKLEDGYIMRGATKIGKVVTRGDDENKFVAVIWPLGRVRHNADSPKEAFQEVIAKLKGYDSFADIEAEKKERKAAAVQKGMETKRRNKELRDE